jgi:polyphosphate glucokinase
MTNKKGHLKALGVDIGGSSTKFCLIDKKDKSILKTLTVPHKDENGTEEICSKILHQMKEWEFEGSIGIGFPGIVKKQVIVDAPNLGSHWNGHDFRAYFTPHEIDVTSVLNDADAATMAMIEQSKDWSEHEILCLTIGTGIGTGWISKGQLMTGTEYGREYIPELQCTLEQWASAKVIIEEELSLHEWVIRFSDVLDILIEKYSPEAIMLCGGITTEKEHWLAELQALQSVRIVISDYEEYTGAYGASLLIKCKK